MITSLEVIGLLSVVCLLGIFAWRWWTRPTETEQEIWEAYLHYVEVYNDAVERRDPTPLSQVMAGKALDRAESCFAERHGGLSRIIVTDDKILTLKGFRKLDVKYTSETKVIVGILEDREFTWNFSGEWIPPGQRIVSPAWTRYIFMKEDGIWKVVNNCPINDPFPGCLYGE